MAQEPNSVKNLPAKTAAQGKTDADINQALQDFLRSYTAPPRSGERDEWEGRYKIDLGAPLPEFDSHGANAYAASDSTLPKRQLFALVCKPGGLVRTKAIQELKISSHPNVLPLVSAGIVQLSRPEEERFVIFYDRPKGKKLSTIIAASRSRPHFEFICQHIIAPISQAILYFNELGFAHGCINPDNIYFDETAVLGPCVAEPCGMSQSFLYEPLERIQAMPAGKGEGSSPQDYYALAVVVLQIIYGPNHFSGLSPERLAHSILTEGAFNALMRQKDMPEVYYDFFRGLLSQHAQERWGYKYLKAWLDGKRYNVMPPAPPSEAMRPFEFLDAMANTRREVAHLFATNWDDVPEAITSGHLAQWVNISLRNKELSEYLARTTKSLNAPGKKNDGYVDEQIMRLITIFDPAGPVRLKNLSFHMDGINSLCASLITSQSQADLATLMRFIELAMYHFVIEQKNKDAEEEEDTERIEATNAMLGKLDKLRAVMRNKGLGFGVERLLYDLNPDMPCLSPMLAGRHVLTMNALLKALDALAPQLSRDRDPIDAHIAAFLASKLNIQYDIKLSELEVQPTLARHPSLIALKLLAAAQKKTGLHSLPGLTHWIATRVFPSLDVLRSNTLRHKLRTMLAGAARSGQTQRLAETAIGSGYAHAESTAFQQAIRSFKQNAIDIVYYRKGDMLEANSERTGTIMAHYGALAALCISFYFALAGA